MENPHEQVQNALHARIINNMERMNESIVIINKALEEINKSNLDIELLAQMWESYIKNSNYLLEATSSLENPV